MYKQQLYEHLVGEKPQENAETALQEIIDKYPFFTAPRFFLLRNIDTTNIDFRKTAAATALHFNNPFYLNFQLHRKILAAESQVFSQKVHNGSAISLPIPLESKKELLFEPLHTRDYFASQGIKLSEEAKPADKLGKQLKSFTDWLKTMKKIQPGKLPEGESTVDIAMQALAEKSNKEEDVITESMADVYFQQGKLNKTREIYKKLSLQDPSKSAYFAAKIESLKEN